MEEEHRKNSYGNEIIDFSLKSFHLAHQLNIKSNRFKEKADQIEFRKLNSTKFITLKSVLIKLLLIQLLSFLIKIRDRRGNLDQQEHGLKDTLRVKSLQLIFTRITINKTTILTFKTANKSRL